MLIEQIVVLAVVQGITEFLPISSSGHLILIPVFTGWPDQGLEADVMVHVGSLAAILAYFWRDVLALLGGGLNLLRLRVTFEGRLLLYIAAASVPALLFGLLLTQMGWLAHMRGIEVVGWNAILWGLALLLADQFGPRLRRIRDMTLATALAIGAAQALALIPGTSRSGITITAARAMGFTRPEAARFSFLVGMPAMAGAGLLTALDAEANGVGIGLDAWLAAFLTFFSALAAIAFLMAVVRRMSFLPFVLYRFLLGGFLLTLAYL